MAIRVSPEHGRAPRRSAAGALALAVACAVMLSPAGASAQLGAGDLQRAHALTANSAGWVALRGAIREVAIAAGVVGDESPEETADTLAVLLALEDGGGRLDAIIIGAARAAVTAHAASDSAVDRVFAEQGLTLARARAISCLVFGQAPEERASIAPALGLNEDEIGYCPTAYGRFRDHWLTEAAAMRAADNGPGQPATVELAPAGGVMASARSVLAAGQTLDEVAAFITNAIASPRALAIRAADCTREAAPEPAADEVRVCYDLIGELAAGIERGIVAGK